MTFAEQAAYHDIFEDAYALPKPDLDLDALLKLAEAALDDAE